MRPLLQLALDFFAPVSESVSPPATSPEFEKKQLPALSDRALIAPENIANVEGLRPVQKGVAGGCGPRSTGLELVVFRHPQAHRELTLGHALVGYALTRARRRTLGFTVGAEGLAVRAPTHVSLKAIDLALQEKAAWILRKLAETQERAGRQEAARIVWRDGVLLPFVGHLLRVRLVSGAPKAGQHWQSPLASDGDVVQPSELHLGLPAAASADDLRNATATWLARHARVHFAQRLDHFAPRMGVRWQRLSLTNARTRWGSARSDGSIRLNWRLMHFAPDVIDYVVVHELAHLRHMNHSAQFWATVESELPDYRAARAQLKAETSPVWRED